MMKVMTVDLSITPSSVRARAPSSRHSTKRLPSTQNAAHAIWRGRPNTNGSGVFTNACTGQMTAPAKAMW